VLDELVIEEFQTDLVAGLDVVGLGSGAGGALVAAEIGSVIIINVVSSLFFYRGL